MCRTARIKFEDGIYHIMVKSMHEFNLYKNNTDKNKFLSIVKKYQTKFNFKLYAYCLMDNHGHLLIDSNGADISKIMQGINQSYAQYFNRLHNRKGHVFFDRFKSKIVNTDSYLLTVSGYIHRNPKDIKRYRNCIEDYKYSSLGIYLGLREDTYNILDEDYVMQIFSSNVKQARLAYLELVDRCTDKLLKKILEFENDRPEYKSERRPFKRNFTPDDILNFLSKYTNMSKWEITMKNTKRNNKNKALYIFLLKCLCNLKDKDICELIGDITQSRVSALSNTGAIIAQNSDKYKNILDDFMNFYKNNKAS